MRLFMAVTNRKLCGLKHYFLNSAGGQNSVMGVTGPKCSIGGAVSLGDTLFPCLSQHLQASSIWGHVAFLGLSHVPVSDTASVVASAFSPSFTFKDACHDIRPT